MPALLTTASRRPNRSTAVSTIAVPPSVVSTEWCEATATPPGCISATTWSATLGSAPLPSMLPPRSLTTTAAPRRARSSAYRRPRPRPAPVTITTCPEKSITEARRIRRKQMLGQTRENRLTGPGPRPYRRNDGSLFMGRLSLVTAARSDDLSRFKLVASAIAGRAVEVASVKPGERPWTDGVTVFADGDASPRDQLRCVAVQAALLAA